MISKSYILQNLKYCDRRFRNAASVKENLFFSKLAIIELCGWIEVSMDDVTLRCARRRIKVQTNIDQVHDTIVGRNYGFDYNRNFRKMLISIIGLSGIERLEKKINQTIHLRFVSTLTTLKMARNNEAHTYVKGITRNIDAPSITLIRFNDIYVGLTEIDSKLSELGY
jgi:hypothetical protein